MGLSLLDYNQRAMSTAIESAIWWLFLPVRAVVLAATLVLLLLIPAIVVLGGVVGVAWFAVDLLV